MECVLLPEELYRLCWSCYKCFKREQTWNRKEELFFSIGIFTKKFYIGLDKTGLFAAQTPKFKARPDLITLFGIHQKESKTLSSNNYLRSFTQNQSKLPRNHTYILQNAPYFNTLCWYNCKKFSLKTYFTKINTLFVSL